MLSAAWRKVVRAASRALLAREHLTPTAAAGRNGEEQAYWYLRGQGFIMAARNYRPEGLRGEIDLIGWEGRGKARTLVFVEVKTRGVGALRAPEAAVDSAKAAHIKSTAAAYRKAAHCYDAPYRFDVVTVELPEKAGVAAEQAKIQHFRDAFR